MTTPFSAEEQEIGDWDWFAVDMEGCIGQFASAGARLLPPSVAADKESWNQLWDFIDALPPREPGLVCSQLSEHKSWRDKSQRERYVQGFLEFASRGLFAFDAASYTSDEPHYFRVAIPRRALTLDEFPQSLKRVLNRTTIPVRFGDTCVIPERLCT